MAQRGSLPKLRTGIGVFVGLIFVWAGFAKLASPLAFAQVVGFLLPGLWDGSSFARGLALFIGTAEVALGSMILTGFGARPVLALALLAVAGFSIGLVVLALFPNAPACGCFGHFAASSGTMESLLGLARNAALAWMIIWLLVVTRNDSLSIVARAVVVPRTRGAFSLVELLVAIVIISILVTLAMPLLAGARNSARLSARVQMIRQLGAGLGLYCQSSREMFPYFATRGDPLGPITIRGVSLPPIYFRSQRWFWASVVVPDFVDAPRAAIEPPGRAVYLSQNNGYPEFIIASSYQITSTVFAASRYWSDDPESDWNLLEYYRPTMLNDVMFPSRKGLLIADLTGPGGHREQPAFPVGMADGSAFAPTEAAFDPARAVVRPHGSTGFPVEATRDGLAGWDF